MAHLHCRRCGHWYDDNANFDHECPDLAAIRELQEEVAGLRNIPIAQTPDSCQTLPARGMPTTPADLEAAVLKMRALGVTKWNGIELGPEPPDAGDTDTDQPSESTVADRVKAARAERQRVASLASGGPVPAVGRSAR